MLSTATAIEVGKRTKALTAWVTCLRDRYKVTPHFAHVDKDMGEIGMLRNVWPSAKIQLCWWHMRKAVRERLAKSKLSTSPYSGQEAHAEYSFINAKFLPPGKADPHEHEGGIRDDGINSEITTVTQKGPNSLSIRLPNPLAVPKRDTLPVLQDCVNTIKVLRLTIWLPGVVKHVDNNITNETDEEIERRTFCPIAFRPTIVQLLERHFCAHPLIPGYSAPTPAGVREWAVKQMYNYCHENDLYEVWAYLWENWYRSGRWELWARSANSEIPVLKTTMILESQ